MQNITEWYSNELDSTGICRTPSRVSHLIVSVKRKAHGSDLRGRDLSAGYCCHPGFTTPFYTALCRRFLCVPPGTLLNPTKP